MSESQEQQAPQLVVNAQYVKDLSFENPGAPGSFTNIKTQPKIDISVDINAKRIQEQSYEVALQLSTKASTEDGQSLFLVELAYAGVFTLSDVIPEEQREPLLLIYCPNLIFPFARRIIADVTRDGGFPPLMVDPIDFGVLYQRRQQEAAAAAQQPESAAN